MCQPEDSACSQDGGIKGNLFRHFHTVETDADDRNQDDSDVQQIPSEHIHTKTSCYT